MSDFQDLVQWWEEESQKDLNSATLELGKRLIEAQSQWQKRMEKQEQRFIQREQKILNLVNFWKTRLKTLESRLEILIEMEVESQKIAFSNETDKVLKAYQTMFIETVGTMLQSFQEILREQNSPKGRDTAPKA